MSTDEQQIRQLVSDWLSATQQGETETILGMMTDDVIFLGAGRQPMVGKEAFAMAMRGQPGATRPHIEAHSEIGEIRIEGDWAWMWTTLRLSITMPGAEVPIHREGNTLTILRKENEKWLIVRDANMLTTIQPFSKSHG